MKFRTRVLLCVLLPATTLLAVAVTASVATVSRTAASSAKSAFDRSLSTIEGVLSDQFEALARLSRPFGGTRIDAAITECVESGDPDFLAELVANEFGYLKSTPDFYEVADLDQNILLQHSEDRSCTRDCGRSELSWNEDIDGVLTVIDGEPYAAIRLLHENGTFVFATRFRPILDRLCELFAMELILLDEGMLVYSSKAEAPDETTELGASREQATLQGERFLVRDVDLATIDIDRMALLRSTQAVDRVIRRTVFAGIGGLLLSVALAAAVSARVARGVSRPIERLVHGTRRVGRGDYSATVDIPGGDEIARLGTAFNEMTDGLRKRREIMEQTLSRDVADRAMEGIALGGSHQTVTVLFADIRGFTRASAGVDPAVVVVALNEMLHELAQAVTRHGGNINKFLGDGLMVMFGAPDPVPDAPGSAVRAALDMRRAMAAWNERRAQSRKRSLEIGIGINTGDVLGGWIGAEDRLEYTLIGETVNLASRLCDAASPGQILVSRDLVDALGDSAPGRLREIAPIHVKGIEDAIPAHELLDTQG